MTHTVLKSTILALIISVTISCTSQKNKVLSPAAQLTEIMNIWPGTYSNQKQIADLIKKGEDVWRLDDSGKDGFLEIKSHYIKLNRPDIGDHVLYVEEYRDNTPEETYRQRIYTLSVDPATNGVKVKMWPFKDKKKYIGAWKNTGILKDLSVDEISAYPDKCDLSVDRIDGKYHMYMRGKECAFGDKYYNYQVMLSPNVFSFRDKITLLSTDELVSTAGDFQYHDLDRMKK